MFNTPILFIVFNRPEQTKKVFAEIASLRPRQLFIAADGPRNGHQGDAQNCQLVRILVNTLNWDCDVQYLYQESNLGCKDAVTAAIDWFFNQVPAGIILEDDCLPHPAFFNYCEQLLEKYKDDEQIMHISGTNFQSDDFVLETDYYFSRILHVWGWASWSRAWKKYEKELTNYNKQELKQWFEQYQFSKHSIRYWDHAFTMVKEQTIDTWDYQWTYCLWKNNGLAMIPKINLVSNIGFGNEATHTDKGAATYANLPTFALEINNEPISKQVNAIADSYTFNKWYIKRTITRRVIDLIKKITQ
jgi:hypothetical protein